MKLTADYIDGKEQVTIPEAIEISVGVDKRFLNPMDNLEVEIRSLTRIVGLLIQYLKNNQGLGEDQVHQIIQCGHNGTRIE